MCSVYLRSAVNLEERGSNATVNIVLENPSNGLPVKKNADDLFRPERFKLEK